jgi:ABC-type transport system substrate-binding protein
VGYNSGNSQREMTAVIAQAQLAEVGIRAEVQSLAWPSFVEGYQGGTLPMFVVSSLEPPITEQYLTKYFLSTSAGPGGNYAFYENPEIDRLTEELGETTDEAARQEIMDEAQRILNEEVPMAFLYDNTLFYVTRQEVKDWVLYPSGDWFFRTVYKDPHRV